MINITENFNNLKSCHICNNNFIDFIEIFEGNDYDNSKTKLCTNCNYMISINKPCLTIHQNYKYYKLSKSFILYDIINNTSCIVRKSCVKTFIKNKKTIEEYIDLFLKIRLLL